MMLLATSSYCAGFLVAPHAAAAPAQSTSAVAEWPQQPWQQSAEAAVSRPPPLQVSPNFATKDLRAPASYPNALGLSSQLGAMEESMAMLAWAELSDWVSRSIARNVQQGGGNFQFDSRCAFLAA
jgi:hypothetical protein